MMVAYDYGYEEGVLFGGHSWLVDSFYGGFMVTRKTYQYTAPIHKIPTNK